jgi:hypothetical protein
VNLIARLLGAFILPVMMFRMAGGLRTLWPAMSFFLAIGFGFGYLVRSFT